MEGSVVLFKSDESKKRLILHLNTKIKVEEANEKDKLSVKRIVAKFNVCKTRVWYLDELK